MSENPGSRSSSPARPPGAASSSTAKPPLPGAGAAARSLVRYAFCCLRNASESFCSSIASVRCTFCFTCAARAPGVSRRAPGTRRVPLRLSL
jgi:hypothetical protein